MSVISKPVARLEPLDKRFLLVAAALLGLIGLVLLQRSLVGVQVLRTTPADSSKNISSRAPISVTFGEPMLTSTLQSRVTISPSVAGNLRWNGSTLTFEPVAPLQANTEYVFTVQAGAESKQGRVLRNDAHIKFSTGALRVAFLTPESGTPNLVLMGINPNDKPQQITNEPLGIFDFAIAPDATRIVFSAKRTPDGDMDLYLINTDGTAREQLLACTEAVCRSVSWNADGTQIAFEKRTLIKNSLGSKTPGPARIWVMDMTTRQSKPIFDDTQQIGFAPRWSPRGNRLTFYDSVSSSVAVYDADAGDIKQFPSVNGDAGVWSPDGTQLLYVDLLPIETRTYSQLFRADWSTSNITLALPISTVNDFSPSWSPSGKQAAFSRQTFGSAQGLGGQAHVVVLEGSPTRQLTNDAGYNYGALSWSSDEQWLVSQRFNLTEPNARPEIWLINPSTNEKRLLFSDALLPAWLP